jgi:hypothetical protein
MKCSQNGTPYRFGNKNLTTNERNLFNSWWNELTQLYGTYVEYYTYGYALSAHDYIYGEHPMAPFLAPQGMVVLAELSNDSMLLSKFGIQTDADLTVIIPIDKFIEVYGPTAEPKSGDLIKLTELGTDRPNGGYTSGVNICANLSASTDNNFPENEDWLRGPNIYEITERRDENVPLKLNLLQGHYIWMLHLKRFDYSYQPYAPRELGSSQVSDETLYGKLSGGTPVEEPPKPYPQNANAEGKRLWDNDIYGTPTNVYGGY